MIKNTKILLSIVFCISTVLVINIFGIWYNSNLNNHENKYIKTVETKHENKMNENYQFLMKELDKYQLSGNESQDEIKQKLLNLKSLGIKSESMTLPTKKKSDEYVAKYRELKQKLEDAKGK